MKRILLAVQLAMLAALLGIACDSEDPAEPIVDGSPPPKSGMLIEVNVLGTPEYMNPLTITFTYRVGWETPDTLVATAYARAFRPMFELLSADSAWVDTLDVRESRTHSFVMRPLQHGGRFSCTLVSAYVDDALTIGASDCVYIDTE